METHTPQTRSQTRSQQQRSTEEARSHAPRASSPVSSRTRLHTFPPTPSQRQRSTHTSDPVPSQDHLVTFNVATVASRTRSHTGAPSVKSSVCSSVPVVGRRGSPSALGVQPDSRSENRFQIFDRPPKGGSLRMRVRNSKPETGETPRVVCVRSRWNSQSLTAVAAKLVIGQAIVVTWSQKCSPTLVTWHGFVKSLAIQSKSSRMPIKVDYGEFGIHNFPPNLQRITVHKVIITPFELDKINVRTNRCSLGDVLVHRFNDSTGSLQTWSGTVVWKIGHQLGVVYTQYPKRPLRFPMPATAKAHTTAFWFVHRRTSCPSDQLADHDIQVSDSTIVDLPSTCRASENNLASKDDQEPPIKNTCSCVRLCTFNCRTARSRYRMCEIGVFLKEKKILIACLQETRWHENTVVIGFDEYRVYRRHCTQKGIGGEALLVHRSIHVENVTIDDVGITVEIGWRQGSLSVIGCYAPHRGHNTTIRDAWWTALSNKRRALEVLHSTSASPIIVLGDLNSELDKDTKLEDFIDESQYLVMNEHFTKPTAKKTTFYGTQSRRAVLDCCLINKRHRSTITNINAVRAPIPSDHRPLIVDAAFKARQSIITKSGPKPASRPSYNNLPTDYSTHVLSELARLACGGLQYLNALIDFTFGTTVTTSLPTTYSDFATANRNASTVLRTPDLAQRTDDITALNYIHYCYYTGIVFDIVLPEPLNGHKRLDLEHERIPLRRLYAYRSIEHTYSAEELFEVTRLAKAFDAQLNANPRLAWSYISQIVATDKTKTTPTKSTPEEIIAFFKSINGVPKPDLATPTYSTRSARNVIRCDAFDALELDIALNSLHPNKAIGLDDMPSEVLRLPAFRALLLGYANEYLHGVVPLEVLKTRLALVPKKGDLSIVSNYRGIAIVSVFLKLLNRLLLNRLRALDRLMRYNQNGFRPNRGTAEQGLAMKMLIDAIADGLDLSVAFVDFSKAFDSVTFAAVRAALEAFRVPANMISAIFNCYKAHTQTIPEVGATWQVETGVLQGDTLAPFLFVLLLDCILEDSLDPTLGLRLDGHQHNVPPSSARQRALVDHAAFITDLDYADDLALLVPNSSANTQTQLRNLERGAALANLKLNVGKNKTEVVAPIPMQSTPISLADGRPITYTDKYTYLGQQPLDPVADFKRRKGLTWSVIHKFDPLWKNPSVPTATKLLLLRTFALGIFTHGSTLWPATVDFQRKIDSAYKCMLRWCCWTPGTHKWDQVESYQQGAIPLLSSLITQLRIKTLGHAIRHDQAMLRLVTGTFYPPQRRGIPDNPDHSPRPRSTLEQLALDTGLARCDWVHAAADRTTWNAIGRHAAYNNEYRHWRTYGNNRRSRWCNITRIATRNDLRIAEVHASTRFPPIDSNVLMDYHHPPIFNSFAEHRLNPLHTHPRTPLPQPAHPPRRRTIQRWDWTPAAAPDATPQRPRTDRSIPHRLTDDQWLDSVT